MRNIPRYPKTLIEYEKITVLERAETPNTENMYPYTCGPLSIPNWPTVRAGSIEVSDPSHMKVRQVTMKKPGLLYTAI